MHDDMTIFYEFGPNRPYRWDPHKVFFRCCLLHNIKSERRQQLGPHYNTIELNSVLVRLGSTGYLMWY